MPSITVCISASSTGGLTTVQNFRDWLGTTATSEDTLQQLSILRASRWAEATLGYPIAVQIYSETVASFGGRELLLSRTPVLQVLRVFDSTTTSAANSFTSSQYRIEDAAAGVLSRDAGFAWTAMLGLGVADHVAPGSEVRRWLVEYVAGWQATPGSTATCNTLTTSTGYTVPDDIEMAVFYKTREMYQGDANIDTKRIGDLTISYYKGTRTAFFDPAVELLAPYRRVTI